MCHDEKEGNKNMKLNLPYMPRKDMKGINGTYCLFLLVKKSKEFKKSMFLTQEED